VTLTVVNTGGQTSTEQAVQLTLPGGISAASVSVDGASAGDGPQSCILPGIAPGASVTVVITLDVAADAQDGSAHFQVPGSSADVDLTVDHPEPAPAPTTASTGQPAVRKDDATSDQPTETIVTTSTTGP
jgi:hypothetical protein